MNKKLISACLLASMAFAGCTSTADQNNGTGENPNDVTLLQNIVDNASDDDACYHQWNVLLNSYYTQLGNGFFMGSEGGYYEYLDNKARTFTEEDRLYYAARENVFTADEPHMNIDVTDINDSYGNLEKGFGLFDKYDKESILSAAALTDTQDDELKGTLDAVKISDDADLAAQAFASMVDSLVNYGYIRYVDPIHNASLYNYDLKTTDDGYTLTLTVKDLEAFKKASTVKSGLVDTRTNRPVLGLDQIEAETWTMTFDKDGMLKESENEVLHALSAVGDEAFVDLMNKTTLSKDTEADAKPSAFEDYFKQIEDGTLKDKDSFDVKGWK